jgi:hypothetical protein
MTDDQLENLSRFDDEAAPADPSDSLPSTKDLPDGIFVGEILAAEMAETPVSRDTMLRLRLNVRDLKGQEILCAHSYPFSSQFGARTVSRLLADLITLGIDADRWTPANKRPFSTELGKLLSSRRLVGLRFQAKKESWDGGQAFKISGIVRNKGTVPMTAAPATHGGMVVGAQSTVPLGSQHPPVRQGSPRPAPAPAPVHPLNARGSDDQIPF